MLLANQNEELKNKLNKLILEQNLEKHKASAANILLEDAEINELD